MISISVDVARILNRCLGRAGFGTRLAIGAHGSFLLALGLILPLLLAATPARAADPIIGTWKLNVAHSTFSPALQSAAPKEFVEVLQGIAGGRIELSQRGVRGDGARVTFRITFPAQGGVVTVLDGPGTEGFTFVETRVSPGNWYVTVLRRGKQVFLRHKVVNADGKTKRETVRGVDERGQPFEQIEVYERIDR